VAGEYVFVIRALSEGNLRHDPEELRGALRVLEVQRATWQQLNQRLVERTNESGPAAAVSGPHARRERTQSSFPAPSSAELPELPEGGSFSIDAWSAQTLLTRRTKDTFASPLPSTWHSNGVLRIFVSNPAASKGASANLLALTAGYTRSNQRTNFQELCQSLVEFRLVIGREGRAFESGSERGDWVKAIPTGRTLHLVSHAVQLSPVTDLEQLAQLLHPLGHLVNIHLHKAGKIGIVGQGRINGLDLGGGHEWSQPAES
jgi:hypothetical protein